MNKTKVIKESKKGLKDWQTCHSCGFSHPLVEAGGAWYCPNPICSGCNGGQVRHLRECEDCNTTETNTGMRLQWACKKMEIILELSQDLDDLYKD